MTTAFALAADYRLVRTYMADGEYTERSGVTGKSPPTVYVLIQPDGQNPVVFQQFDSKMMEAHFKWLKLRTHDVVVHFYASALIEPSPTTAQWDAFQVFCKTNDIKFVNESDTD